MNHKPEARAQAFVLYQAGSSQRLIAQQLQVAEQTVSRWQREDHWRERIRLSAEEVVPIWAGKLLFLLEAQFRLSSTMQEQLASLLPASK